MLRETQISSAPTPVKLAKMSDGGGLQLWLMPSGARLWRLSYRFEGAQRALKLGRWPDMRLADARKERDKARGILAAGGDPGVERRPSRSNEPAAVTLKDVTAEWRAKQAIEERAPATVVKNERLLAHALPFLGDRPIRQITAPEILQVLRELSKHGYHDTAERLRMLLSVIFRHGIATGQAESDPAASLRGALPRPKAKSRRAIVEPKRFDQLLSMIVGFKGLPPTQAALKLLPLRACRPGELRLATWDEFDLAKSLWTIPAARMKMRVEHWMHLTADVVAILRDLQVHRPSRLLVPCPQSDWQANDGQHGQCGAPLTWRAWDRSLRPRLPLELFNDRQ